MGPAGLQDREKAIDVGGDVGPRIDERVAHAGLRREMDHIVRPECREDRPDLLVVCDICARERERRRTDCRQPRLFEAHVIVVVEIVDAMHDGARLQ